MFLCCIIDVDVLIMLRRCGNWNYLWRLATVDPVAGVKAKRKSSEEKSSKKGGGMK